MASSASSHTVLILGGGFAGIRAALDLDKHQVPGLKIILISNRSDFEYRPHLYRIVTGAARQVACIPLSTIFRGKAIKVVKDTVTALDPVAKTVSTTSRHFSYDFVILALGSETSYFHIEGLPALSYGFKSIEEALKLNTHLASLLIPQKNNPPELQVAAAHFIIVGGGPSGCELAAILGAYAQKVARRQHFDPSFITIDVIEAAPRLLPLMPADFSQRVQRQLNSLGVNIFLNRTVIKEEAANLLLKDMSVTTKTVIWTAGMKPNSFYAQVPGLVLNKRGYAEVDEHLRAQGFSDLFILGDAAVSTYPGLAQTALQDGAHAALVISNQLLKRPTPAYHPKRPIYAIPAGSNWAAILWGEVRIYGQLAWFIRQAADLRFLLSILPPSQALRIIWKGW